MTATTIRPTVRPSVLERIRPWWLWLVTALAFPPAGYIAHQLFGQRRTALVLPQLGAELVAQQAEDETIGDVLQLAHVAGPCI